MESRLERSLRRIALIWIPDQVGNDVAIVPHGLMRNWYLLLITSIILIAAPARAQEPADGRWLPDGTWQARNLNATVESDAENPGDWPVITDWGNEIYVSDTLGGDYIAPRIVVSDSILHVFGEGLFEPHHYVSYNEGDSWEFFANYNDTTFNIRPGIINAFCDNNRLYTVWMGRRGNENTFVYFRASSDYGVTWPITAEIIERPYHWRPARFGNISGCKDTVFVSFEEDSIAFWRSYDMGVNWDDLGYIADGFGLGYPPSICYSAGIINIVYNWHYLGVTDVYYIKSHDHGETWSDPVFIGFFDNYQGQWPEVAADSMGNIAVSWMDYTGSPYTWQGGIWVRVSHDSGTTWNPAVRMDTDYRGDVATHVIIDGSYVGVVWRSIRSDDENGLHYRESWDGGVTWGEDQLLDPGQCYMPRLVKRSDVVQLCWPETEWIPHLNDWRNIIKYMRNDHLSDIETWQAELIVPEGLYLYSFPNPFNSIATLILSTEKGGDADIKIYDLTGALVKNISAKEGKAIWDATNNSGRSVSSGIYFARVETPQKAINHKLILLK